MGGMSLIHWIVVGAIALLLFGGRGKLSSIMKDAAEGIKGFRKGLADDSEANEKAADDAKTIEGNVVSKSKTEA